MRLSEARGDFPKIPNNYPFDEESGLYLNRPSQWSDSPYLGAVTLKNGTLIAQIHIPQRVWESIIYDDNHKWQKVLPASFFNDKGQDRHPIRFKVNDPRKAAWIMQSVLYGSENTDELIEDYLIAKFIDKSEHPVRDAWGDILKRMPKFTGEPIKSEDKEQWFASNKDYQKKNQIDKNRETFKREAPDRAKKGIVSFANKGSIKKKIFGTPNISINGMVKAIDNAFKQLGTDYFFNGIKLKNPLELNLSRFVTESINENFDEGDKVQRQIKMIYETLDLVNDALTDIRDSVDDTGFLANDIENIKDNLNVLRQSLR